MIIMKIIITVLRFFLFILVMCWKTVVSADTYLQGIGSDHSLSYSHDRFYVGSDKVFIGNNYDWSGIGQNSAGQWATMISPSYFISANHYHPNSGETLTFYSGNNTSQSYNFTVTSGVQVSGLSDLWLGKLSIPIPASDNITTYPLWNMGTPSSFVGLDVFLYGVPNKVGRNTVAYVSPTQVSYVFNASGGDGSDEAYLMSGDSGGPSFGYYNGQLALVGTHWQNEGTPVIDGYRCSDSYISGFISTIQSDMVGETLKSTKLYQMGDANLDGKVNFEDFQILLDNWQNKGNWLKGDFNGDGVITFADFQLMTDNWSPVERISSVPENSIGLLVIGGIILFLPRRNRLTV